MLGVAARAEARLICLLMLLLAGCASGPQRYGARVEDWESPDYQTAPAVTVAPVAPPPPASAPMPAPPAPAAATNRVIETWIPLYRWCKAHGLAAPSPLTAAPAPGYALSTTNGVFVLRAGSQVAHWDGVEVRMAFAPQMRDGEPFVHGLDLKKTIEPLVWGAPMRFLRTNLTIVIDPGHGGEDSGATSVLGNRYEKEFTPMSQPLIASSALDWV